MTARTIRNYSLPVSLGGAAHPDAGVVTLRWFGTASFELAFGDRVVLLDNFYERPPRNRPLGFDVTDVTRADLLLVGHPHHDHVADTARVSQQTGAKAAIAEIGADYLLGQGLPAAQIHRVTGRGEGEVLDYGDFTVRALHGFHLDIDLPPERAAKWQALLQARADFEADFFGAPTAEEDARPRPSPRAGCTRRRSSPRPRSPTSSTSTASPSPTATAAARSATRNARTSPRTARWTWPSCPSTASRTSPSSSRMSSCRWSSCTSRRSSSRRITTSCGSTSAAPGCARCFADVSTELLKERVHDELPATITAQPGLIEPVTIDRGKGDVTVGDVRMPVNAPAVNDGGRC